VASANNRARTTDTPAYLQAEPLPGVRCPTGEAGHDVQRREEKPMSLPEHVRPIHAGDHGPWRRLWTAYLKFYRESIDDSDQPIGFAHLVFHPSTWSSSRYCYLEDLYVDPARRGDGTAGDLFDGVYALAREQHATRVYWHTQQFNAPARSLYDTVGRLTSFVVYEHSIDP